MVEMIVLVWATDNIGVPLGDRWDTWFDPIPVTLFLTVAQSPDVGVSEFRIHIVISQEYHVTLGRWILIYIAVIKKQVGRYLSWSYLSLSSSTERPVNKLWSLVAGGGSCWSGSVGVCVVLQESFRRNVNCECIRPVVHNSQHVDGINFVCCHSGGVTS